MFDPLVKSYINLHPAAAARTLASLQGAELREVFEEMPRQLAAKVLEQMNPAAAGRALEQIAPKIAAGALERMNTASAVSALRHVEREKTKALFTEMPRHVAARLRLRLRYPETVVGSCVNTDVFTLNQDHHVGDALRLLRRSGDKPDQTLCVLDDTRHLVGIVDLSSILAARDRNLIRRVMRPAPVVLHSRDTLLAVESLPAWLTYDHLPVINRNRTFVGMLPRAIVFEEETRLLSEVMQSEERGVTRSALADIFWLGLSSLFVGKSSSTSQEKGSK